MQKSFILGADDPEMQAIVACLKKAGQKYGFAAIGGQRCHAANAYQADSVISPEGEVSALENGYDTLVFVECRPWNVPHKRKRQLLVIDHHEEGDPGYDLEPEDFWEASSLGQLICMLRTDGYPLAVTRSMLVLAAMDHCRQAAIRGECPDITPHEVMLLRVREIAAAKGVTSSIVRKRINEYIKVLREREAVQFGPWKLIDLTDHHLGIGYSLDLLCAQTALDIKGLTALLRHSDTPGEWGERISISGHATPEMVTYFMQAYAKEKPLYRVFGVPRRGYAGGFLRP